VNDQTALYRLVRRHAATFFAQADVPPARLLACAVLACACAAAPTSLAWAQGVAKQPVRFIVPIPTGGQSDIVARLLADAVGRRFESCTPYQRFKDLNHPKSTS